MDSETQILLYCRCKRQTAYRLPAVRAQAVAAEAQTIGSGTSGDIIGKYERGENIPSIEVAAKIADALGVTLDTW